MPGQWSVRGIACRQLPPQARSIAGSNRWAPVSAFVNRVFPAAAATNVLTAVPGATAGDFLIVEMGYRNFTTVVSGGSMLGLDSTTAGDLPEDETTQTNLNPWIDICA